MNAGDTVLGVKSSLEVRQRALRHWSTLGPPAPTLDSPAPRSHALRGALMRQSPGAVQSDAESDRMNGMQALVKNGRLVLDEPTELPEGQVIELMPLDEVLATDGDDLDDEERAALHASIDESIEDEEAGNVRDLSKIIAELRAQL
jgi:hypothetical protein